MECSHQFLLDKNLPMSIFPLANHTADHSWSACQIKCWLARKWGLLRQERKKNYLVSKKLIIKRQWNHHKGVTSIHFGNKVKQHFWHQVLNTVDLYILCFCAPKLFSLCNLILLLYGLTSFCCLTEKLLLIYVSHFWFSDMSIIH